MPRHHEYEGACAMHDDSTRVGILYPITTARRLRPRLGTINIVALSFISIALSITACKSAPPAVSEYYGAQIGIVNHTDRYIDSASVDGGGGGNSSGYHAGVANICCVRVPVKWRPGLQLTVWWNMPVNGIPAHKEKIVDVERYDEPGSVYLHFFPDDRVKIVVTNWDGYSDKHPIPPPSRELYENLKKLKRQNRL